MSKKKYYAMYVDETTKEANISIYGDITSWPWMESDVSSYNLAKEIEGLDVEQINVYINSYGGEVGEAVAICSALQRHKAKVITYCDGFACSAASVIFACGDERIMGELSLLMIHNCMSYAGYANSEELRKMAEDNDKINSASIKAYMKVVNISEDELKNLMDEESWITSDEAMKMGFATAIAGEEGVENTTQSARQNIRERIIRKQTDGLDAKELAKSLVIEMSKVAPVQLESDSGTDNTDDSDDTDPEENPDNETEEKGTQKGQQMLSSFLNALSATHEK